MVDRSATVLAILHGAAKCTLHGVPMMVIHTCPVHGVPMTVIHTCPVHGVPTAVGGYQPDMVSNCLEHGGRWHACMHLLGLKNRSSMEGR